MKYWVYNLLLAFVLFGCSLKESTPEVYKYPSWYYTKPQSDLYYYGIGESDSIKESKNMAIKAIVDEIMHEVDDNVSTSMRFSNVKVVEMLEHRKNVVTLVSVEKKALFDVNANDLSIYFRRIDKINEEGSDEFLRRYIELRRRVKDVDDFEHKVKLLKVLNPKYNASDLRVKRAAYQKKIDILRQAIRISIVSDDETKAFVSVLKKSIKKEGISINDKNTTFVSDYSLHVSGECKKETFALRFKVFNFEKEILSSADYSFTCKDSDEKLLAFEKIVSQKELFLLLGL